MAPPYHQLASIRIRVSALIHDRGEVLLVRHAKDGHEYYLLPGGGVDPGERLDEALRREVREETGLSIEAGPLLALADTIAPRGERHILHIFFRASCRSRHPEPGQTCVDSRVVGHCWVSLEEWKGLPFLPDVKDELVELLDGEAPSQPPYIRASWVSFGALES